MACYEFQLIFHGCAMTSFCTYFCNMLVVGYCLIAVYSISHFSSIVLSVYQIRGTYGLLQTELIIHNIILCTILHLFDDLGLDKIIPKNNDRKESHIWKSRE